MFVFFFFFSIRRRHTRCALVTGVQTCALPISLDYAIGLDGPSRAVEAMRRAAMQAPVGLRKPLNRALQIRLGQGERQTHEALERTVDREARSWRDTQAQAMGHCRELTSVLARKLRPKPQPALGHRPPPLQ